MNEIVNIIKLIYYKWNSPETNIKSIIDECKYFDIDIPNIELFSKIMREIQYNNNKFSFYFKLIKTLKLCIMKNGHRLDIKHFDSSRVLL